ncbi:MAG: right-handed parallel beta-helix repeat-containing protein, partial [Candidatus Krumholzibacteria bacterium]|nr:right-handed parallel beta-helix repeat-containing protein [Candidatus Krumholzibacteria bacterium]
MRKLATISAIGLLGLLLLAGGSMAATLNVPSTEYPTIQSAIDAAVPGDVVQVAAGTYRESLGGWRDISISKSISLVGAGSGSTIVELSGLQHGVEILPDATGTVLVEGIAFTKRAENTYSAGWAVIVGETGGTFASIILRDVEIAYAEGRNLHFASATYTYALVEDCDVHHAGAWGFSARGTLSDLNIVDSDFEYNGTVDPAHGIGFDIDQPTATSLTVTGGSFSHNTAKGINIVASQNLTFTGITASNNGGAPGGGFGVSVWEYISSSSNLVFEECSLTGNSLDGFLFGTEGTCTIDGVTIDRCYVSGNGRAGVFFYHDLGGSASGIAVNGCYLAGNGWMGIARSSLSASIDGSANWWGDATPAGVAAAAGSNLDFTPWLASGTDLSADPGFQADWSVLWVDDDSPQTGTGGRIQEGVDLVSGSTVNLAPGTYEEQVEIAKDLVLQGAGAGLTEILSPVDLPLYFGTNYPIVYVHDTEDAEIRDLTVNGAGRGNANYRFVGVAFRNAGGGIYDCSVLDVRDTPFSGAQHGVAVYAYNDDLAARAIDVHGCTITGFQKNAMALNAGDTTPLTVDVQGNTITGAGATDVTAQNGVQVWAPAGSGTVAGNTISGIGYDNTAATTKWVASSVLSYWTPLSITGNTISGTHVGVYQYDASATIEGNDFEIEKIGVSAFGIIGCDPPDAVPSPIGEEELPLGSSRPRLGAPLAVLDVDIIDNVVAFSGTDNTATYGIEVDGGYGPDDIDATINGNIVTGFDVGIEVWTCETDCDTGVLTAVDARYNGLFDNTLAVRSNAGYLTVDASANWLGSNAPAALVSGDVDYTPWLDAGTDTSVDPGFQGDYSVLHASALSPQVGYAGRVQEGVDLVSGSTLYVHDGTYEEQVEIAK